MEHKKMSEFDFDQGFLDLCSESSLSITSLHEIGMTMKNGPIWRPMVSICSKFTLSGIRSLFLFLYLLLLQHHKMVNI